VTSQYQKYKRNEILKFLFAYCAEYFWQPPGRSDSQILPRNSIQEDVLIQLASNSARKCLNGPLRLVYSKVPSLFFPELFKSILCSVYFQTERYLWTRQDNISPSSFRHSKTFFACYGLWFFRPRYRDFKTSQTKIVLRRLCLRFFSSGLSTW